MNGFANATSSILDRTLYRGETILSADRSMSTDTRQTGLNNNVLVLGSSGCGKTRHHLKPNLLQCNGSYIVLDAKGTLYHEVGPFLQAHGYQVDQLDFTTMEGTVGYNPLDHIARNPGGYSAQDVMTVARAINPPDESSSDPFWQLAAANYLASFICYVLEALPREEHTMASVARVFEAACDGLADAMFDQLARENPCSYAASLYRRSKITRGAEKMHSSIMGVLAANLFPLTFPAAIRCCGMPGRVDFPSFGHRKRALFVRLDDMDRSMDSLTGLFVQQALDGLCREADANCLDGRLPVPVRLMLDDFANLSISDFDSALSVIRSREISATLICQTVSQLEAVYGEHRANSIVGNCDTQVVLGFQDVRTADYYSVRANRPASTLLETAPGHWWVFQRGKRGVCEGAYRLENHPLYQKLLSCSEFAPLGGGRPGTDALPDADEIDWPLDGPVSGTGYFGLDD